MSFIQILLFRQVKKENDILVNNPSDSSLSLVPDPEKVTEDSAPVTQNVKKSKKYLTLLKPLQKQIHLQL